MDSLIVCAGEDMPTITAESWPHVLDAWRTAGRMLSADEVRGVMAGLNEYHA